MKQYFFTHDDPPSQPMVGQHDARTPFRTKEDAEAAMAKFAIENATGCQELHDYG